MDNFLFVFAAMTYLLTFGINLGYCAQANNSMNAADSQHSKAQTELKNETEERPMSSLEQNIAFAHEAKLLAAITDYPKEIPAQPKPEVKSAAPSRKSDIAPKVKKPAKRISVPKNSKSDEADENKPTKVSELTPEEDAYNASLKTVSYTNKPFQDRNARPYQMSDKEKELVLQTVANESADEPYEGQMGVAQCIYDACVSTHERPDHVLKPGQYAVEGKHSITTSVKKAVNIVFSKGYRITNENIRWFYAPEYCTSKWHEEHCKYVFTIGGHRFFSPKV